MASTVPVTARPVGESAAFPRIIRGDQVGVPCVFMRGGTSRGAFLNRDHLPTDPAQLERLILAIYGSPDVRQIDGLGGADPLTSKVAIVGRSSRPDADVDFTFGQVRISEAVVDFSGNCGNMSAGIGPFAIDEGLVDAVEPITTVRIYLTNTDALITARVPVRDGLALVEGEADVPGVPGTGASIMIDFGEGSSVLGRGLLPTGEARETLETAFGEVDVSIVDAGNPVVFVRPTDGGLKGTELPDEIRPDAFDRLEALRGAAAVRLGLTDAPEAAARLTPAVPKVYAVGPPADYTDLAGRRVGADEIDLVGRGLSMQRPHRAYAVTVGICTAAAALLPGTLVADVAAEGRERGRLRIGHPSGVMVVEAELETGTDGAPVLTRAAVERTARRIMDGTVYVPASKVTG